MGHERGRCCVRTFGTICFAGREGQTYLHRFVSVENGTGQEQAGAISDDGRPQSGGIQCCDYEEFSVILVWKGEQACRRFRFSSSLRVFINNFPISSSTM